jgi:DNA mismatch endonuclease, patch repair protein
MILVARVRRLLIMKALSREKRHRIMAAVKSQDTEPERLLRLALWHRGIRYRKNWRQLTGKPDIVLTRYRIAVFVDGDFWHGRGHEQDPGGQVATNREFWQRKIGRNVERDREVNDALLAAGWLVLRFWESDIRRDVNGCVDAVLAYLGRGDEV